MFHIPDKPPGLTPIDPSDVGPCTCDGTKLFATETVVCARCGRQITPRRPPAIGEQA
jgi:hypothetical protein